MLLTLIVTNVLNTLESGSTEIFRRFFLLYCIYIKHFFGFIYFYCIPFFDCSLLVLWIIGAFLPRYLTLKLRRFYHSKAYECIMRLLSWSVHKALKYMVFIFYGYIVVWITIMLMHGVCFALVYRSIHTILCFPNLIFLRFCSFRCHQLFNHHFYLNSILWIFGNVDATFTNFTFITLDKQVKLLILLGNHYMIFSYVFVSI